MTSRLVRTLFLASLFTITIALSPAHAQATRSWVSGVGDDVNPCSRTAPCKTFAGAISKTLPGGEIDVIDPGSFGPVTITKSIIIDGHPFEAGVLASGGNGIIVNAAPTDVVRLRGLNIFGTSNALEGVKILQAGTVIIEDCTIEQFTDGVNAAAIDTLSIERSSLSGFTQAGILFNPSQLGSKMNLRDVSISGATNGAVSITPSGGGTGKVSIDSSRLMASSFGLRISGPAVATVMNSVASGNTNNGFVATGAGSEMFIVDSNSVHNGANGVASTNSAKVRLSRVAITNNSAAGLLASGGGTIETFSNVNNAGNVTNGTPTGTIASQ